MVQTHPFLWRKTKGRCYAEEPAQPQLLSENGEPEEPANIQIDHSILEEDAPQGAKNGNDSDGYEDISSTASLLLQLCTSMMFYSLEIGIQKLKDLDHAFLNFMTWMT